MSQLDISNQKLQANLLNWGKLGPLNNTRLHFIYKVMFITPHYNKVFKSSSFYGIHFNAQAFTSVLT